MQTVGELVRNLREEKNLTQKDLATRSRVPRSTIAMVEAGDRNFSSRTAKKVFNVLLK